LFIFARLREAIFVERFQGIEARSPMIQAEVSANAEKKASP